LGFIEKVKCAAEKANSLVCVGLDTDIEKIPVCLASEEDAVYNFNEAIIQSTSDLVCAYKPNSAFYEALGSRGIETLQKTCKMIPSEIPVILDIKRGDISNTAVKYADFAYAVKPFLKSGKCVFVLCITSNDSAKDFQFLDTGEGTLYERVAKAAVEWACEGEVGLVVGATKPETIRKIRDIAGDMPILVPGVGAQGGDIEEVIEGCGGEPGLTIINSSRGILYASKGTDFPEAARLSLFNLRKEINQFRKI